jgi:hypothetical protein
VEWPLVAVLALPHSRAGLHRLFDEVEALAQRRERQFQSVRLLRVVAGADAEMRALVALAAALRRGPGAPAGPPAARGAQA